MHTSKKHQANQAQKSSRFPQSSLFFDKVIPVLLIFLGILMVLLILFAVGVLAGFVQF